MPSDKRARVTWLLPVLNGMPYLPKTLESIEAQTYKDWEVLAWDNGSSDGSVEELRRWIPSRLPGRIVTGKPLPLGLCLAAMVSEADGEYLARIDCDDINFLDRLEAQVALLDARPEVGVVSSQAEQINEDGSIRGVRTDFPTTHEGILHRMPWQNAICHPASLLRKSAVLAVGNYRDRKPVEDYDLWFRLADSFELANVDRPLIYYRMHSKSVTQKANADQTIHGHVEACFAEHLPRLYGISEEDARLLYRKKHPNLIAMFDRMDKIFVSKYGGASRWKQKSFTTTVREMTPWDDRRAQAQFLLKTHQYGKLARGVTRHAARFVNRGVRKAGRVGLPKPIRNAGRRVGERTRYWYIRIYRGVERRARRALKLPQRDYP